MRSAISVLRASMCRWPSSSEAVSGRSIDRSGSPRLIELVANGPAAMGAELLDACGACAPPLELIGSTFDAVFGPVFGGCENRNPTRPQSQERHAMTSSAASPGEITVPERVRARDLVLFAITSVALLATPWMLVSAGSEPVFYEDSQGHETEMPAWVGVLVYLIPLLAWSGLKVYHLLENPAVAVAGPDGIRLFGEVGGGLYARKDEPVVDLPWDEVERVVLWRIRRKWLGFIPTWESRVGVEKTTDWYGVTVKKPNAKQRQSRAARLDGSPIRLGAMLKSRSVRLGPHGAKAIAAATARFAPRVEVIDERTFGKPERIDPKHDRKSY
jgi:hypothetical protein